MTPVDRQAQRRWLALVGIRIAGAGGAMLGLILIARAHDVGPKILGIAIVLSALAMIAIVPTALAHRWRSPPR